jgi:hypothetical protein
MAVNIPFFIYAEHAVMQQLQTGDATVENKMQVLAPSFVFRPAFVPCLFSFSVAVGLKGFDVMSQHKLQMKIYFNNEDPTIADTGIMPLPPFPEEAITNLSSELKGITFTCDFRNVPFRQNGVYFTRVFFDEEVIGEYPIHIWGRENNELDNGLPH